jgi:hypothetical protein
VLARGGLSPSDEWAITLSWSTRQSNERARSAFGPEHVKRASAWRLSICVSAPPLYDEMRHALCAHKGVSIVPDISEAISEQ